MAPNASLNNLWFNAVMCFRYCHSSIGANMSKILRDVSRPEIRPLLNQKKKLTA